MFAHDVDKFVNREKELALVKEKVVRVAKGDPFAPHERVIHFVGPSGMGKSFLLEKLHNDLSNDPLYKSSCISILIKLETIKDEQDGFTRNFIQVMYAELSKIIEPEKSFSHSSQSISKLASLLVRTINLSIPDKVLVLLLDEINIPQKKELRDIEELILEKLLHNNIQILLITAGRLPVIFEDFALRPSLKNTFALPAFDVNATSEQLELRSDSSKLAERIRELGGGAPGNNKKLSRHIVGEPPHISNELQAVNSLLVDVKQGIEEHFHPVIEAICILTDFFPDDVVPLIEAHPKLGEQWNNFKIKEVFIDLKQIQIGPGRLINWDREKRCWVMDEPTRALFELELKLRDPGLWKKLHCKAYQMYKNWGEAYSSRLFKDKATYHQQCLQSAGMDCEGLEG